MFSSSSPIQDRIEPTDTGSNQGTIIPVSSILLFTTLHLYSSQFSQLPCSACLSILAYLLFQHGTEKSLPPLQYTYSCQPYRSQLMSTQPQQQIGVTLSPTTGKKILHHRSKHQPRPTATHGAESDSGTYNAVS